MSFTYPTNAASAIVSGCGGGGGGGGGDCTSVKKLSTSGGGGASVGEPPTFAVDDHGVFVFDNGAERVGLSGDGPEPGADESVG